MRVLVYVVMVTLSACSWEGVVDESERQAAKLRLIDSFQTDVPLRWRLPPSAKLQVIPPTSGLTQLQKPWLEAAQQGVDRVSGVVDMGNSQREAAANFYLTVIWPEVEQQHSPKQERERVVSLFGVHVWPKLPRQGRVRVHLQTDSGDPIYQANFDLSGKLWGQDWRQRELLEQAFFELAVDLRGS